MQCASIWLLKNMITSNGGKRGFKEFHYACEACDFHTAFKSLLKTCSEQNDHRSRTSSQSVRRCGTSFLFMGPAADRSPVHQPGGPVICRFPLANF